jgi:hypothetical protein
MVLFRKSKRAAPFTIEPEITPARYGLASENDRSSLVLWLRLANHATARKVVGCHSGLATAEALLRSFATFYKDSTY